MNNIFNNNWNSNLRNPNIYGSKKQVINNNQSETEIRKRKVNYVQNNDPEIASVSARTNFQMDYNKMKSNSNYNSMNYNSNK